MRVILVFFVLFGFFVLYTLRRHRRYKGIAVAPLSKIQPLSVNLATIIHAGNIPVGQEGDAIIASRRATVAGQIVGLFDGPRNISIEWSDIALLLVNSRNWMRGADKGRLEFGEYEDEFNELHSQLTEAHCRTVQYIWRAVLERMFNSIFRRSSCLYACVAAHLYSQEAFIAIDLFELCAVSDASKLEGHF